MIDSKAFIVALLLLGASAPALAQQPAPVPAKVGNVVSVVGPAGSVMVFRGSKAYALLKDDVLFNGDRVFTRASGEVDLASSGCRQHLGAASSIILDEKFCKAVPISLGDVKAVAAGGAIVGSTGGAVSASPNLLGLLAPASLGVAKLVEIDGSGG